MPYRPTEHEGARHPRADEVNKIKSNSAEMAGLENATADNPKFIS